MTRKQIRNLAKQIYQCELIHNNESSSKEAKLDAEDRIMRLTNQIMSQRDGLDILAEVDDEVQKLLLKGV